MPAVTAPLSPIGILSIVYLSTIFATLSQRLNAVAKKGNHHRWFRVANGLLVIAAMGQAIQGTANLAPDHALPIVLEPWFPLITFHIPLAVGATVDLLLVWYYWGWILRPGAT
ncbi:MAG: hypothetical protein ACOC7Y_01110 [Chloroflexota bacterium]